MAISSSQKIVKNSAFLYARMAIVMVINLYVVRLVLKTLGVVDYGIYDVVAGIVVMFNSISNVLSMSTQRFFSYALGESNKYKVEQVFSSSIYVFFFFSIIIILVSESIGMWFLNTHLDIPGNRMVAANWVFHFSVLSFVFTLLQTPFSSAIISYEDMDVYSIISLGECFLKFLFVFILSHIQTDKLISYAFFLMVIPLISLTVYMCFVKIKYKRCRFRKYEYGLWRELLVFAGWTMFGSAASIGITQVCTILVNIFFGPVVNAARAIASHVSGILNTFSVNYLMAVRPPMIKAYAEKQYDYLNVIFNSSNKLIFYGMLMIFIPLYLKMDYVLSLWLDTNDKQTILFCRLMLVYTFVLSLSNPITIVIQATGNVKQYHLWVEIPTIAIMPTTYILFKLGFPPQATYYTMIVAILMSHMIRLVCLKYYYSSFDIVSYLKSFLLRASFVTLMCCYCLSYVNTLLTETIITLILLCFISILTVIVLSLFIGLDNDERKKILRLTIKIIKNKKANR